MNPDTVIRNATSWEELLQQLTAMISKEKGGDFG